MQSKLQEIREACIKANPEIMKLKFGCEVMFNGSDGSEEALVIAPISICPKHKKWSTCESQEDFCDVEDGVWLRGGYEYVGFYELSLKNTEIKEILGRPITLPDVLLAIDGEKVNFLWNFHEKKWMFTPREYTHPQAFWNLLKPLKEQDEPTINFIHSLLVKKI